MVKFKRILPPLPSPEVMQGIYERMLEVLMDTPQERWDEYLEESHEPLEAPCEFIENVCPECGGLRTANLEGLIVENRKFGHHATCSRWKKYWRYKDVHNGILI